MCRLCVGVIMCAWCGHEFDILGHDICMQLVFRFWWVCCRQELSCLSCKTSIQCTVPGCHSWRSTKRKWLSLHFCPLICLVSTNKATHEQWRSQGLPGWASPEGQKEDKNVGSLRKNKKNKWWKFEGKVRKVELSPTRDCKAGYAPAPKHVSPLPTKQLWKLEHYNDTFTCPSSIEITDGEHACQSFN